jgi:hypothetical protein
MSDNPFANSPQQKEGMPAPGQQFVPPQQPPGALTAISVISLILGILGLLGACGAGFGVAMQGFAGSMLDSLPPGPDVEFQKLNIEAASGTLIPSAILGVLGLIVGAILTIGSIGCLRRKESGRTLLRTGFIIAIIYCFLKIAISTFAQMQAMGKLNELVAAYEGEGKEQLETMIGMAQGFSYGGMIFAALVSLVFAVFYFWARGYLNKEQVISYFASSPVGH